MQRSMGISKITVGVVQETTLFQGLKDAAPQDMHGASSRKHSCEALA